MKPASIHRISGPKGKSESPRKPLTLEERVNGLEEMMTQIGEAAEQSAEQSAEQEAAEAPGQGAASKDLAGDPNKAKKR